MDFYLKGDDKMNIKDKAVIFTLAVSVIIFAASSIIFAYCLTGDSWSGSRVFNLYYFF